jgi:X-Pro dipeptidyl-peptidase-like protein
VTNVTRGRSPRHLPLALAQVSAAALVLAGSGGAAIVSRATGPTTQELMVTVSDGTQLACELVLPDGSPPTGGWPGVLLIFGIGGWPGLPLQRAPTVVFAPAGLASLSCDARGTGASGGEFDFAGGKDVQDVRDLFEWFAARPDISDTEIGALGTGLGGAEIWNAAVAGVPFKAIVPTITWTSLGRALTPDHVIKWNLLDQIIYHSPWARWDSTLARVGDDLRHGRLTKAVERALKKRSPLNRLHSLTVPTLIIQNRHDLWFDLDQAIAGYRRLAGPKRLYIGSPSRALTEIVPWFKEYLVNGPPVGEGVELAHGPWDGTTTSFPSLPRTRTVLVNLRGVKTLPSGVGYRSAHLPSGTLEAFGGGFVDVRYSGASAWTQITASILVSRTVKYVPGLTGKASPITEGAAPITKPSGFVRIRLMNTAVLLGSRVLTIRLGPTIPEGVFNPTPPPPLRTITIGRVMVHLSILAHAVSK